ncbi:MFS transporter [Butyrivibrio sp. MC2013]|uniref:MFS transporter n=1 Tax=Butyrivibrio sp. MC2013 TaxID=1280686 RepID=UPI00041A5F50|nr:MFS transporter [Butyrivibrio sp. MC2013]
MFSKDNDRFISFRYILLNGNFWSFFCVGAGFLSLFLAGRGMTPSLIGIFTAVFSLLAVIIQPLLGNLADHHSFFNWRRMIVFISIPVMIGSILLIPLKGMMAGGFIMGMILMLSHAIMPFISSADYYYNSIGRRTNYGIARAIGSGGFALMSYIIGLLSDSYGSEVLPVMAMIFSCILIVNALTMPWLGTASVKEHTNPASPEDEDIAGNNAGDMDQKVTGLANKTSAPLFLAKYPGFSLMLLAVLFMYFSHNTVATYLIQVIEELGGGSEELGKALALQAGVEIPVLFLIVPLKKRLGVDKLMIVAGFGYLIKAILYASSYSITFIYISQLGQMLSFAILAGASVYYTAKHIDAQDQVTGQAFMTSMMAAGAVLGSLAGGWIIDYMGIRAMLIFNVFVAAIAAVLTLVSHFAGKRITSRK